MVPQLPPTNAQQLARASIRGQRVAQSVKDCLFLLLVLVGFFSVGCASTFKPNAPPLSATPVTSSLVVIGVESTVPVGFNIQRQKGLHGGMLLSTDGFMRVTGHVVSNLLIFLDLPAGEYRLARIVTTWQPVPLVCSGQPMVCAPGTVYSHTYDMPADGLQGFAVSAILGEPKFLGVVMLESRPVQANQLTSIPDRDVKIAIKQSKEAEVQAWDTFVRIYDGHPWANEVQKRLSELKQ